MTSPIKRQRSTKRLIYMTLYFLAVLFLNFGFIISKFFEISFLQNIMLIFDMTLLIGGIITIYKIIGSL